MPSAHLNFKQMDLFNKMAKQFKPTELMTKRELLYLVMGKLNLDQQAIVLSWIKAGTEESIDLYNITQDQSYWLLQAILKRDMICNIQIEVVKTIIMEYI